MTVYLSPIGTSNRLRALQALGWSAEDLARHMRTSRSRINDLTGGNNGRRVTDTTAGRVAALYDRLSMHPGNSPRTRKRALERGWAPPLAWDDDQLDRPGGRPTVATSDGLPDPVVVARCLAGERLPATRAERLEVIRRWQARGGHLNVLDDLLGWNSRRDLKTAAAA